MKNVQKLTKAELQEISGGKAKVAVLQSLSHIGKWLSKTFGK